MTELTPVRIAAWRAWLDMPRNERQDATGLPDDVLVSDYELRALLDACGDRSVWRQRAQTWAFLHGGVGYDEPTEEDRQEFDA